MAGTREWKTKEHAETWREQEKVRLADVEKTARLRNLRLAKESAEKAAAEQAAAEKRAATPRRARSAAKKD
jgi:hypothetical protein